MPTWPKDQLLRHGPELPLAERICRYQHNIRPIWALIAPYLPSCSTRPRPSYADSAFCKEWLKAAVVALGDLPQDCPL